MICENFQKTVEFSIKKWYNCFQYLTCFAHPPQGTKAKHTSPKERKISDET